MSKYVFSQPIPVRKIRGCYLLYKNGRVVYVGQSINVMARIGTHLANPLKSFDCFSYTEIGGDLNEAEADLIAIYGPNENSDMPKNSTYASSLQIKTRYGIGGWAWKKLRGEIDAVWKDYYRVSEVEELLSRKGIL